MCQVLCDQPEALSPANIFPALHWAQQAAMLHPVIVEQRDPKTDQHHENQKFKKIFHQLTCEKVCPCLSTIKSRKR
jgi:hypothetical protein